MYLLPVDPLQGLYITIREHLRVPVNVILLLARGEDDNNAKDLGISFKCFKLSKYSHFLCSRVALHFGECALINSQHSNKPHFMILTRTQQVVVSFCSFNNKFTIVTVCGENSAALGITAREV